MQSRLARHSMLLVAALATAACSANPSPLASPTSSLLPSPAPASPSPAAPSPSAIASPIESPNLSGLPFTVLVLGGDDGFRTDAIMVVGVDPANHALAFASIPRDTINVPLPGGGTFANQKVNAFWNAVARNPATYPQGPGRATADMVGTLLGIRIDYYAATTFSGFQNLVRAMGGVSVTLAAPIFDPSYQVTMTQVGVRFPAGPQQLNPERALIFVRTRHADSDFARARRQQQFLLAAGNQLLAHPELWPLLLQAQANLITDFPLTEIPDLLGTLGSQSLTVRQAVLGPTQYESSGSCPCGYALVPKLAQMRALAASFFPWAVAP